MMLGGCVYDFHRSVGKSAMLDKTSAYASSKPVRPWQSLLLLLLASVCSIPTLQKTSTPCLSVNVLQDLAGSTVGCIDPADVHVSM